MAALGQSTAPIFTHVQGAAAGNQSPSAMSDSGASASLVSHLAGFSCCHASWRAKLLVTLCSELFVGGRICLSTLLHSLWPVPVRVGTRSCISTEVIACQHKRHVAHRLQVRQQPHRKNPLCSCRAQYVQHSAVLGESERRSRSARGARLVKAPRQFDEVRISKLAPRPCRLSSDHARFPFSALMLKRGALGSVWFSEVHLAPHVRSGTPRHEACRQAETPLRMLHAH